MRMRLAMTTVAMQNFVQLLCSLDLFDLHVSLIFCVLCVCALCRVLLVFVQLQVSMEQTLYKPNKISHYQRIFQVSSLYEHVVHRAIYCT